LRILLTNITLASRSGTELVVRDLSLALQRRGERPAVYTPDPGSVADEIRASGIEVVDDLAALAEEPEVIHGHHSLPLMAALTHFSRAPALFVVHDRAQWTDRPPRHPRLRRWVAVDDHCRERLAEAGLPDSATAVILNAVDLERFPRRAPLPERPRRALLFSNYADEGSVAHAVRAACSAHGIQLDLAGSRLGGAHPRPEEILGEYDLVFGKARCALEALAVGCAVVVCDVAGVGGLVREETFEGLRRLNFGRATLRQPVTQEALEREIAAYDAQACTEVAGRLRAEAGLDQQVAAYQALYREIVSEGTSPDPEADARALAAWLPTLLPPWTDWISLLGERERLASELARLTSDLAQARAAAEQGALAKADAAAQRSEAEIERRSAARWSAEAAALADEVAWMRQTPAWTLRRRMLGLPGAEGAARWLARARSTRPRKNVRPMPIIIGVPRSGTTLLRLMLDAHPQLAVPPETGFLPAAAQPATSPQTPDALVDLIRGSAAWPDFHLTENALRRELGRLRPFTVADGVRAFYGLYARRFAKPRWGEKSPGYGRWMAEISALLPEARFVHLLRDGRDVAVSVRGLWFAPGADMTTLASDWKERIEVMRAQSRQVPHYLEVRYEALVEDPVEVLRRVSDFVELEYDPAMLDYPRRAADRLAEHEASFDGQGRLLVAKAARLAQQERVMAAPDRGRSGRWRNELTAAERAAFEAVAGPLLRELGYETSTTP
jgi:hypothetical protein